MQNFEVGLRHAVAVVVGEANAATVERAPAVVTLLVYAGVTPASNRRPHHRCD